MDIFVLCLYILGGIHVTISLCACLVGCYCIASHILALECCFLTVALSNILCCGMSFISFIKKKNIIWKLSPEQLINESGSIQMEEEMSDRSTITTVESLAKVQPIQQSTTVEHVNTRTRRFSINKIEVPNLAYQRTKPKTPHDNGTIIDSSKMIFTPCSIDEPSIFLIGDEEGSITPPSCGRIVSPIDIGNPRIQIDSKKVNIIRPLGEGSYGQVFLGTYKNEDGKPQISVAVKVEPVKTKVDQIDRREEKRILKEIMRCTKLDHPNVVKYYGCIFTLEKPVRIFNGKPIVGTDNEYVSKIIMEYCEKGDLYELIKTEDIYKNVARKIRFGFVMGIARGICYLHKKRMIHRDLKPDNILISNDYEVKICDFGSSKAIQSFATIQSAKGTPEYIDPCLIAGLGPKNTRLLDIYSFGIMMWAIWVGEHPYRQLIRGKTIIEKTNEDWYEGGVNLDDVDEDYRQYFEPPQEEIKRREPGLDRLALMRKIKLEHIRPDTSLVKKVPRGYVKLMKRCWSPNFRSRPQDMDSILVELNQMSKRVK